MPSRSWSVTPGAEHWSEWTYTPGLNPTAGLAGRLHQLGVTHPWLDRATDWTWERLESGFDEDAHALSEVLVFLAHVPDRGRAETVGAHVGDWLSKAAWYWADPSDPGYGLTPLHLAPSPDSPWRRLFDDITIEGHLDRLVRDPGARRWLVDPLGTTRARLRTGVAWDRDAPGSAHPPAYGRL